MLIELTIRGIKFRHGTITDAIDYGWWDGYKQAQDNSYMGRSAAACKGAKTKRWKRGEQIDADIQTLMGGAE